MVLVIVNSCFGGFSFSEQMQEYKRRKNVERIKCDIHPEDLRFDPIMVDIVKNSDLPHARYAKLRVVDIPQAKTSDDVSIREYDGMENAYFSSTSAARRKLAAFDETNATLEQCRSFICFLKRMV